MSGSSQTGQVVQIKDGIVSIEWKEGNRKNLKQIQIGLIKKMIKKSNMLSFESILTSCGDFLRFGFVFSIILNFLFWEAVYSNYIDGCIVKKSKSVWIFWTHFYLEATCSTMWKVN